MSKNFEMLRDLRVNLSAEAAAPVYDAPGLGSIPDTEVRDAKSRLAQDKWTAREYAVSAVGENQLAREEASKLVHNLFLSPGNISTRVVIFAAIDSGNGCSRVSSLVARTLAAQAGAPVCLVDANLRTPSPNPFKVNNDYGLADALRSPGPITEFLTCVGPENLAVLSCGSGAKDSVALLASPNMRARVTDLRNEFAYILIDAPPLNSYADAIALGQVADGVVLILEANATRRESAMKVADHLRSMHVKLLGAVLNKRTFPIPQTLYDLL
ncbi:MAG TPA: CpsD/CapB family tyrosine-protein kinase [Candidatus Acidoferrales bacterium]|nr:CpsD/CapB family tyrosine-protein kinase [Candidatus Acidoferrales bacterium]